MSDSSSSNLCVASWVDGECSRPSVALGLCNSHYAQHRREGKFRSLDRNDSLRPGRSKQRDLICYATWDGGKCKDSAFSKGLCAGHYKQHMRTGKFTELGWFRPKGLDTKRKLLDWCYSVCEKDDNGCWNWSRTTRSDYGLVSWQGKYLYTHRLSVEIDHGNLQPTEVVHHMCANKRCMNPSHLRAVKAHENIAEAFDRKMLLQKIDLLEKELLEYKEKYDTTSEPV